MVDSKQFRGEKGVLTMTYTVNTQMLQLQTGAAYLDRAETTVEAVLMHYKDLLKENKVTPMLEGTGEWGEAFRLCCTKGFDPVTLKRRSRRASRPLRKDMSRQW